MKTSGLSLCALFAGCIAVAACSQAPEASSFQSIPNVNGIPWSRNSTPSYNVLYEFRGKPADGSSPLGSLTVVDGTPYGTTVFGGVLNAGTVFELTGGSSDKVLHSFTGGSNYDGSFPEGGVIDVGGTLYGTTSGGGKYNGGTVFSIAPDGTNYKKCTISAKEPMLMGPSEA